MKHPAFTLVEMLTVLVMIGVLAIIAVPRYVRAEQDSAITATAQDLRAIENAVNMYYARFGSYPRDVNRSRAVSVLGPFFKADNPFSKYAPIGGKYDYEGPPNWNPVQISIRSESATSHSQAVATELDKYMDDGDLKHGVIRRAGDRTFYIIGNN